MSETGFLPARLRTSLADIVACTGAAVIESAIYQPSSRCRAAR